MQVEMKVARFLLFLTASLIGTGKENSANARMVTNSSDALEYLERYGYINRSKMEEMEEMGEGMKMAMMKESVKMFQMFSGMKSKTGKFDEKTMEMMNVPRCGNKENMAMMRNADMPSHPGTGYMLNNPWEFQEITYRIENIPKTGLSPEVIRREIRKAFDLWEGVANITCKEIDPKDQSTQVDIDIAFVTGPHNDNQPFSRQQVGVPVAHAYYPYPQDHDIYHLLGGDIHFDSTRGWTINTEDGINFFQTATHEIGHALGLEHSSAEYAVMHGIPSIRYDPNFALHIDDIKGIQKLYGARIHKKETPRREEPGGDLETSASASHFSRIRVRPPQPGHQQQLPPTPQPPPVDNVGSRNPWAPSLVVMYHFQPLKYLWYCHQLAVLPAHRQASLLCYEQVTRYLIYQPNRLPYR